MIACGEDPPPPTPRVEPPPPPAPIAGRRGVSDHAAFALVPSDEGALLVIGVPYLEGGGVRAISLGAHGEQQTEVAVATLPPADRASPIAEIDAAAVGRRVGVAW